MRLPSIRCRGRQSLKLSSVVACIIESNENKYGELKWLLGENARVEMSTRAVARCLLQSTLRLKEVSNLKILSSRHDQKTGLKQPFISYSLRCDVFKHQTQSLKLQVAKVSCKLNSQLHQLSSVRSRALNCV